MTERPTIDAGPGSVSRRQILKTGGALVVSAGALGPLLAACGSSSSTATPQQVATFGLANAFAGFNPATAVQVASLTITHHVFDHSCSTTSSLTPSVPGCSGPSGEGRHQHIPAKLLSGLTFHDGTPVRPSDVVFTINYMKDPKNGAALGAFLNQVDSVTASGDAIVFHLAHEFAAFNSLLSVVYVMPEKAFTTLGNDKFTARPVGSGPYSFAATQPESRSSLTATRPTKGASSLSSTRSPLTTWWMTPPARWNCCPTSSPLSTPCRSATSPPSVAAWHQDRVDAARPPWCSN